MKKTSELESALSKTEKFSPFYVHYDETILREKLQPALLDILIDFHQMCQENDIFYIMSAGTLLGAVREGGFIKWDDDIDLLVRSDGYERIQEAIVKSGLQDKYYFSSPDNCSKISLSGKFVSKTVTLGQLLGDEGVGHPLYIEMVPIENVPDNPILCGLKGMISKLLTLSYNSLRCTKKYDPMLEWMAQENSELRKNLMIRRIAAIPGQILGEKALYQLMKKVSRYPNEHTARVTVPFGVMQYQREMQPRSTYAKAVPILFEGHEFMAPENYHAYLTNRYGDYMTPPPLREQGIQCFEQREDWETLMKERKMK